MAIFKKFVKHIKKMLKNKKKSNPAAKKKKRPAAAKKTKKKAVKGKKTTKSKAKKKKAKKKKKVTPKAPRLPSNYERIGIITHYFPHVQAGVIKVGKGSIKVGDEIHIKGATTDFKQRVISLQIDHAPVQSAKKGDEAGLQTKDRVRQHDTVYRIKSE